MADYDYMEMPAPCSRCGDVQELHDFPISPPGTVDLVCDDCQAGGGQDD